MANGRGPIANLQGAVNALGELLVSTGGSGGVARPYGNLSGAAPYTDAVIVAAPAVGTRVVITNVIASIGADAAFSFTIKAGATVLLPPLYLNKVGGFASGPIAIAAPSATAITVTSTGAVAQSFHVAYEVQPG